MSAKNVKPNLSDPKKLPQAQQSKPAEVKSVSLSGLNTKIGRKKIVIWIVFTESEKKYNKCAEFYKTNSVSWSKWKAKGCLLI